MIVPLSAARPSDDRRERDIACPVCGRESCEEHLPSGVGPKPRLQAQRALDLVTAPRPVEIVEGIAYGGCVTVLAAESGAGKTFVLLDLAGAVSDGAAWHGRAVQSGSVIYCGFEGDALGLRLRALHEHAGRRLGHVYVLRASEPLSPIATRDGEQRAIGEVLTTEAIEALRQKIDATGQPPIVLLVIDTVRASMAGSEDNSQDVSAYLRAVRRLLASMPGAAVILAHHVGWQDGEQRRRRERGSSAWRGNCDVTLYLEATGYDAARGEAPLTLSALKVRDVERPAPLHLLRRRVELAEAVSTDLRRGPITSCVIDVDRRTRADREAEKSLVVDAEARALDRRLLDLIARQPELAKSQDTLRASLGVRKTLVSESIARLLRAGAVIPGGRGQPYSVTPVGRAALETEEPTS